MSDKFRKGRWYRREDGKPFQIVEMHYISEKDGRWRHHFEFKATDGECLYQDIDFISGEGLPLKNGWEACDPPTQKKGIDRFEAGKWYRYTGTREDAPFKGFPRMCAVLDNKPHKCISSAGGRLAIFDCTDTSVGEWNWYNFDNWEEVFVLEVSPDVCLREDGALAGARAYSHGDWGIFKPQSKTDRVKSFIASL